MRFELTHISRIEMRTLSLMMKQKYIFFYPIKEAGDKDKPWRRVSKWRAISKKRHIAHHPVSHIPFLHNIKNVPTSNMKLVFEGKHFLSLYFSQSHFYTAFR